MANAIEVREVVTTHGETTATGMATREETTWQVGATLDGVFVPFATIDQGKLDHARQRQEAAEARDAASKSAGKSDTASTK